MLSGKIESVRVALAELAGVVGSEQWAFIACCRRELEDARSTAAIIEAGLSVPGRAPREKEGEVLQ